MPLLRLWAKTQPIWLCWIQGSYPDPQQCNTCPRLHYFLQNTRYFWAKLTGHPQQVFSLCKKLVTNSEWLPNRFSSSSLPGFYCCQHNTTSIWTGRQVTLPLEAARLPFHELAWGRHGGVPMDWKPSAGSVRVTSVARSTSLGPRPVACNHESMLTLSLSPSWQCSDLIPGHRFGSMCCRKDIV